MASNADRELRKYELSTEQMTVNIDQIRANIDKMRADMKID